MKVLAFLKRAFITRPFGGRRTWGSNVERRATRWLARLQNPSSRLGYLINLENLGFEFDLFLEEETVKESCNALQLRVIELAASFPKAAEICAEMLSKAPLARLFATIVIQANTAGYKSILIAFSAAESAKLRSQYAPMSNTVDIQRAPNGFSAFYFKFDEGVEAISMPTNLIPALRGFIRRLDSCGYNNLKQYLWRPHRFPESLEVEWEGDSAARLRLA